MRIVKATDLRPGMSKPTVRTIVETRQTRDQQVHVEWSDGEMQTLAPDASLEVADGPSPPTPQG